MSHQDKTKEQLIVELEELQRTHDSLKTSYLIDRDERLQDQAVIREKDELYRAIYDKSPIAIELYDADALLSRVNPACLQLFGLETMDEIRGFSLFADPNISQVNKEKLLKGENIRYQGPFDFEKVKQLNLYQTSRDGIIWLDVLITPLGVRDGIRQGYLIQIQDISEQKQTEENLRSTELKFEHMVTNINDGVYSLDGETGEYTYWSPVCTKLLGYTLDDVAKMGGRLPFLSIVLAAGKSAEHQERLVQLQGQPAKDDAITDELWWQCKDGSLKCIADQWSPVYQNDRLVSTDGVLRDITERKKSEEALKDLLVRAEASDRLKTAFLNNISHEVRTPLNGILGFAEILDDPKLTAEDRAFYKDILHTSSDRLLDTISSYMDISLIVSGNMVVSNSMFDLTELLNQKYQAYRHSAAAKGVTIKIDDSGLLPGVILNSDAELISKVLDHLLKNAIKFTDFGTVIMGYKVVKDFVEVFVQDTGMGISEILQDQIFDTFLQADVSFTRKHEGSGLGLAIVKGLIQLLGGTIRVSSEIGVGSSFIFTIPYSPAVIDNSEKVSGESQVKDPGEIVVLIAEDDQINIFLLETMLSRTKAVVWHVENGKLALDCCRNNPEVSVVLMDLKMPEMDGFEATRQIKAIRKDIVIIAVTAFAMPGDRELALEAGCDNYLAKPFSSAQLKNMLSLYVNL